MATSTGLVRSTRARIDLIVRDRRITGRQFRELRDFVGYCVDRVERELGELAHWRVTVTPDNGGYATTIGVRDGAYELVAAGAAFDRALATWDAMSRVEQGLRDRRGVRGVEVSHQRTVARPPSA